MVRRSGQRAWLLALLPFVAACGSSIRQTAPVVAPVNPHSTELAEPAPAVYAVAPDPILSLIAESDDSFSRGQQELELGHLDSARQAFDRALDVLLESPYGRTEPRVREQFDRLVDRISALEVRALAEGDGFTEKTYEPASIDELLAMSATLAPEAAAADLQKAAEADPAVHDIPIPLNQRVLNFVQLFQGRLRDFVQEGLQRGSKYVPMIQGILRAEGLPLDLAYVPLVESAFKPTALSRAKAKGVWQFMKGTGQENGLRQDWYIDERSDPEKATLAAAKYLTTLAKMFDGDWHLALASYNGGPGRVQKAMQRSRLDDFWTIAAKPRLLPRETRDYVPMILAAIIIARNPAQYGFSIEPEPPFEYESVTLPGPIDLRHVAEWAGTTIDEIHSLNPELRRWTTPVMDPAYELRVPMGTADAVSSRLSESVAVDLVSLRWYTVKRGDTLATIAKGLRVNRTDLAEANYLRPTARVTIGQKLIVPQEPTVLMGARTDRPAPVVESEVLAVSAAVPSVAPSTDSGQLTYRVKRGDTLASIARLFKTSVASLQLWNGISGTKILAGDRLTIYTRAD